jgi:hypothetical protein
MADIDQAFLQSQTEMLREIRDELRAGRSMQSGGSSGGGLSSGAARPGHTFVAAQSAADKTLMGQWNSLGWSQAYQSSYKSSFSGDLAAMIGFNRAPSTLTQDEFKDLSSQNMAARVGTSLAGIIAPNYAASTNALAQEIHQNSGRFIRFGNSAAGALGTGFDFSTERSLSRQIQTAALGDLRMDGKDYSAMTSLGMRSGQFDSTGNADDFMKKVKEMASATGDLTRALHMSVQEVGTAMGNLRQLGVTGIAQQRSMMMQAGGAAMVAGMSSPEMLQMAGGIAQNGMQMGLNSATTMPAASTQAAVIRSLSQSGIISPQLMAMGGGTAAITNNIMQATMGFAGSMGGYLAFMGGGANRGANTFNAQLSGIGATGMGTFEGSMTMDLDRMDKMSSMTSGQLDSLMRNQMESTIRLSGVNDMTSHTAEGMAFQISRSQGMDEASAHVYAKSNFSMVGRRASEKARMQVIAAQNMEESKVGNDFYSTPLTVAGRIRGGIQRFEQETADIFDNVVGYFDRKVGVNGGEGYTSAVNRDIVNGGGTNFSAADFSSAGGSQADRVTSLTVRNPRAHMDALHTAGFGSAFGVAAALGTFGALNAFNPAGWLALGGAAAAGAVGYGMTGAFAGESSTTYSGSEASDILTAQRAIMKSNGSAASKLIASDTLKGRAWEKLISNRDRRNMDGAQLKEMSLQVVAVQEEAKLLGNTVSYQEVVNSYTAVGGNASTADIISVSTGSTTKEQDDLLTDFGKNMKHGELGFATSSEGSRAAAAFVRSKTGGPALTMEQNKVLGSAGGAAFQAFSNRVEQELATGEGKGKLAQIAAAFESKSKDLGSASFNRAMMASVGFAEEQVKYSGLSEEDQKSASDELKGVSDSKNGMGLLDLLNNSSSKISELAGMNKLGSGFFQAAKIRDDASFDSKTTDDLAREFNLSGDDIKQVDAMKTNGKPENIRKYMESRALAQSGEVDAVAASGVRTANVLAEATKTLERINSAVNNFVLKK